MLLPLSHKADRVWIHRQVHRQVEPTLTYAPPYATVEDDQLAWLLVRYLHPGSELAYRMLVHHQDELAVATFVVMRAGRSVGFVLSGYGAKANGMTPGDDSPQRPIPVDVLVRVEGDRLEEHLDDVLSVVAGWEPGLFSPDGVAELDARVSSDASGCSVAGTGAEVHLRYGADVEDVYQGEAFVWPDMRADALVVRRTGRTAMRPDFKRFRPITIGKVA